MKVLSLFDGISCGRIALERAGIPVEKYYASEIDKYAIQVTQAMFPDTIQVGDVNKLNYMELLDVDIIIGGSPCQDLSIAKQNRQGLRGERSGLFWKYVEALEVIKPKYFLLENVASMKNEDRDAITETLRKIYPETECIMINSALVSAQQRKRYYWTNWHIEQPEDKGILLKDILETGSIKPIGIPQNKARTLTAYYSTGQTLEHCEAKKIHTMVAEPVNLETYMREYGAKGKIIKETDEKSPCLLASMGGGGGNCPAIPMRIGTLPNLGKGQANRIYSVRGKSVCLNALGGGGGAKTGLYKIDLPDGDYIIRKLTPRECCRLQTYDERCFDVANISNTQWYKAFGNGWTVDVIAHILKGIKGGK